MVRHPGYRVCTTLCVWRMHRPVQGVERPQWLALGAVRMAPRGLHSPGDRIIIAADAQEATKLEDSIGDLAADLFDHDPLDGPNMLAFSVIDSRAFHFVAADEASGLPRFWQALGRTLGWQDSCALSISCEHGYEECRRCHGVYWMHQWRCFIQAIADGNTPEVFFANLPASPTPA
jgi:hypothetical protein